MKVWKTWAKQAGHSEEIKSYQPEELNVLLEEFYATVRKQDGTEYEPDSLRVMQAALDRHLRDSGCKFSIIRDREFSESKKVLEGKARQLRQQGKGKRPNKARALTENEEETLWEAGTLGTSSPQVLSQTAWWLLTQYFGLRGRQEHHDMTVTDFKFGRDENNTEFVEFVEGPTQNTPGWFIGETTKFHAENVCHR